HYTPLDDHTVLPDAVELAVLGVYPDRPEPERATHGAARVVLREDAGHELREAGALGRREQLAERQPPDAPAPRLPRDVDRELGHARVALARPVGRGRGEPDDPSRILDHDDGMHAVEPAPHRLGGPPARPQRGDPALDARAVDSRDPG